VPHDDVLTFFSKSAGASILRAHTQGVVRPWIFFATWCISDFLKILRPKNRKKVELCIFHSYRHVPSNCCQPARLYAASYLEPCLAARPCGLELFAQFGVCVLGREKDAAAQTRGLIQNAGSSHWTPAGQECCPPIGATWSVSKAWFISPGVWRIRADSWDGSQ
jgi:hypothetical protein